MTVIFGDGMMVKKPKGSEDNAPKAAEEKHVAKTQKKRGGKKEK